MNYITLEDVEDFFQAEFRGERFPTEDVIDKWIEDFSREVDDITNSTFEIKEHEEIFHLETPTHILFPSRQPITEILEVERNASPSFNEMKWEDYTNNAVLTNQHIILKDSFQGMNRIRVKYKYGHEEPPTDVKNYVLYSVAKKVIDSQDFVYGRYEQQQSGNLKLKLNLNRVLNIKEEVNRHRRRLRKYKARLI